MSLAIASPLSKFIMNSIRLKLSEIKHKKRFKSLYGLVVTISHLLKNLHVSIKVEKNLFEKY